MIRETKRVQKQLNIRGFGVVLPNDRLPDDLLQIARNTRLYQFGRVQPRPGLSPINPSTMGSGPIHSIIRLNDPVPGANKAYSIIVGSSTKVYIDDATHLIFSALQQSAVDLSFSSNPKTFAIARPYQAADPFTYIGDSTRTRKTRSDGVNYPWGTSPPSNPPSVTLGAPNFKVVSDFENTTEGAVVWTNAGTAGAITAVSRLAAMVITYLQYDSGSTGWASIVPATFPTDIQAGMLIIPSVNPETVRVEQVFEQVASTTIGSIQYDDGVGPGACTIQPVIPLAGIQKDMLLRIAGAENVLVTSITTSPDGVISSFRCVTTSIRAATNSIDGLRSFRSYFSNTHSAADTLSNNSFSFQVTAGTGYIDHVLARDLSNTGSRPIQDDDEFHISIQIDDTTQISEIRVYLDIDPTTHDVAHNAFFRAFRPSDFAPAIAGTQTLITAQRTALSRQILENSQLIRRSFIYDGGYGGDLQLVVDPSDPSLQPLQDNSDSVVESSDSVSTQTGLGTSQWSELRFRVKDMERIGTDLSRGLKDVASIRIQVITLGTVNLHIDAWYVGGTYGPDSAPDDFTTLPYYYAYRYRSSITGTRSNFSPITRSGVLPRRSATILTPLASTDPQIDLIDYARLGGSLAEWHIIGTGANSGTFQDNLPDSSILGSAVTNLTDDFQPFPTIDTPKLGVCDVKGTSVIWVSGDVFNLSWARNTEVFIDGTRHTLYSSPSGIHTLELNENVGTKTSVSFFIPEATILGQPLPFIWGPMGGAIFGDTLFAVGDTYQAGVLFYTNPGAPDSCKDINQLEICSGSERLINGIIYRGKCYVSSDQQWYEVVPRFGYGYSIVDNLGAFIGQDTANSKGLYAPYAICKGDLIYYRGKDGIYSYDGGQEVLLSQDLYPLFPHVGVAAQSITLKDFETTTTFYPPDDSLLDQHSILYQDNLVYYTYPDTSGVFRTLVYSTLTKGWNSEDTYSPQVRKIYAEAGKGVHSLILGSITGKLYRASLSVDSEVESWIRTGSDNIAGDRRTQASFYELWLDVDTQSSNTTAIPALDDCSQASPPSLTVNTTERDSVLLDITEEVGQGIKANNIALDYHFSKGSLYGWEFTFAEEPPSIKVYEVLPTAFGLSGFQHIGQIYLSYSSSEEFTLKILVDNLADSYTIPSSGGVQQKYFLLPYARKGKLHGLRVICPDEASIFIDSCEVSIGQWGRQDSYQIVNPFNDLTHAAVGQGS